jgi:hypothetical protein
MKIAMIFSLCAVLWMNGPVPVLAGAQAPNCSGTDRYPTSVAFTFMNNAGVIDRYQLDFSRTKTVRLASEQIGKDLYRQVHLVTFVQKDGRTIEAITVNDASSEECSMSEVQVFTVARDLRNLASPQKSN